MKIQSRSRAEGNALLLALFTAFVVCITLSTYLYLVANQNQSVLRSLSWNSSIPAVEAGVEEALTHLHYSGTANLVSDAWSAIGSDGFSHKGGSLGGGYSYDVGVKPPAAGSPDVPTIESVGYAPAPVNLAGYYSTPWGMILGGLVPSFTPDKPSAKRKVRVMAKRQTPVQYAMLAKGMIDLNGNNISTDSFDSTDPNLSTNGKYDPAKSRDKGDVATNQGIVNSVAVGNADIRGHVSTGPGGSVTVGSNGSIGDKAWVTSNTGVEPGWVTDDTNVDIPDVDVPFTTGYTTPQGGKYPPVTGPTYDFILGTGNYRLSDFHGKVLVTGTAKLLVDNNFSFNGSDGITINPGAALEVYVAAASANLGGNGIQNPGDAMSFIYYGLKSNTTLSFAGNSSFTGTIYAPYADFKLGGSGSGYYDFVGASVTKTVTMTGHFHFHYDESLNRRFPIREYVVFSWNELDPNSTN